MQVRTRFGKANPVVACSARGDVTHTHACASGCRQRRLPVFDALLFLYVYDVICYDEHII